MTQSGDLTSGAVEAFHQAAQRTATAELAGGRTAPAAAPQTAITNSRTTYLEVIGRDAQHARRKKVCMEELHGSASHQALGRQPPRRPGPAPAWRRS